MNQTIINSNRIEEIQKIEELINLASDVTLELGTVTIDEMKRKEFKLKEKAVLEIHNHKISEIQIQDRKITRKKWQTRINSQRNIKKNSYEELILALYDYYTNAETITDYSFESLFNLSLEDRRQKRALAESTVVRYKKDYLAFFTPLSNKDVRTFTTDFLDDYLLSLAKKFHEERRSEKFNNLKTILNMVFNYSIRRGIIASSPVPEDNYVYTKTIAQQKPKPEDKAFQPYELELIRNKCLERINRYTYDVNAFAILFVSYTGLRAGEIPTLKWNDINFSLGEIHIHTSQVFRNGSYESVPYTKDEKGIPQGGRKFPINNKIEKILRDLQQKQHELGINSEYVFCKKDGTCMRTDSYASALRKLCIGDKSKGQNGLGLHLCNNHAFRIAFNSYVLVPIGLPSTKRAELLGHSPKVNEENYTFGLADNSLEYIKELMNEYYSDADPSRPNIISFKKKEKSLESAKTQALI